MNSYLLWADQDFPILLRLVKKKCANQKTLAAILKGTSVTYQPPANNLKFIAPRESPASPVAIERTKSSPSNLQPQSKQCVRPKTNTRDHQPHAKLEAETSMSAEPDEDGYSWDNNSGLYLLTVLSNQDTLCAEEEQDGDGEACVPPTDTRSTCSVCKETDTPTMVQCTECIQWIHYKCTYLPSYMLHQLGTQSYVCMQCTEGIDEIIQNECIQLEELCSKVAKLSDWKCEHEKKLLHQEQTINSLQAAEGDFKEENKKKDKIISDLKKTQTSNVNRIHELHDENKRLVTKYSTSQDHLQVLTNMNEELRQVKTRLVQENATQLEITQQMQAALDQTDNPPAPSQEPSATAVSEKPTFAEALWRGQRDAPKEMTQDNVSAKVVPVTSDGKKKKVPTATLR